MRMWLLVILEHMGWCGVYGFQGIALTSSPRPELTALNGMHVPNLEWYMWQNDTSPSLCEQRAHSSNVLPRLTALASHRRICHPDVLVHTTSLCQIVRHIWVY